MSAITLTREQLYERVWTTPIIQLAQEFGISDVAVTKTCKRLQVPTPPRGYWAKVEAGQKPKKTPLPKLPIAQERQGLAAAVAQQLHTPNSGPVEPAPPKKLQRIELPSDNRSLHPVARELRAVLSNEAPDQQGLLQIHQRVDLPTVAVSKKAIDALVRSFHAILTELETRGVEFRKFRGKYGHPAFHCGQYQLSLSIEELIETIKRQPTEQEKRRPSWEWQLTSRQPSGRFQFSVGSGDYYNRSTGSSLVQKPDVSLEEITARVIEEIWDTFVAREKSRLESEEKWRRDQAEAKIRAEQERKAQHQETLKGMASHREENLIRAAQWWRLQNTTADFIDDCERRWKSSSGLLTPEQEQWVVWARARVKTIAPVETGYPDPANDGPFDPAAIPFGGPYPSTRRIPRPPTMPAPPPPPNEVHHHHSYPDPKPYPYWLKYQ